MHSLRSNDVLAIIVCHELEAVIIHCSEANQLYLLREHQLPDVLDITTQNAYVAASFPWAITPQTIPLFPHTDRISFTYVLSVVCEEGH
jgi:hypothetical protein